MQVAHVKTGHNKAVSKPFEIISRGITAKNHIHYSLKLFLNICPYFLVRRFKHMNRVVSMMSVVDLAHQGEFCLI